MNLMTDASGVQQPSVGARRGESETQSDHICASYLADRKFTRMGAEESVPSILLAERRDDERRGSPGGDL